MGNSRRQLSYNLVQAWAYELAARGHAGKRGERERGGGCRTGSEWRLCLLWRRERWRVRLLRWLFPLRAEDLL